MKTKRHGRETTEHFALKNAIALAYREAGFPIVVTEQNHCDVVAGQVRGGRPITHCIEIERTAKNVLRNVRRNLSLRCDRIILVCTDAAVQLAVQRKLKALTVIERNLIRITTTKEFKIDQDL